MIFLKFFGVLLLLLSLLEGVVGYCSGYDRFSCEQSTCCTDFGQRACRWGQDCRNNPGVPCMVEERKRTIANLTQILGMTEDQIERDLLQSNLPLPDAFEHVRPLIEQAKRRLPAEGCYCPSAETSCNPIDCEVSQWADSGCSTTCGPGTNTRTRYVTRSPANGGAPCPPFSETQPCDAGCCPVNCNIGGWSDWSGCSVGCGGGTQSRSRSISAASCGGSCSESQTTQSQQCNTGCCPVNCNIGGWSDWSGCSAGCGGGTQSRSRSISAASCGGSCSESQTTQSQQCNTQCCASDCVIGAWSGWTACSAGCGGGSQSRSRSITAATCGGSCSESQTSQSQQCNTGCCPSNCVIGAWSGWGTCSVGCGGGSQSRSRSITPESCGGSCSTGVVNESQNCNTGCCAQNCQVSDWSQWAACSQQCGGGTRSRNRAVTLTSACGGSACPTDLSQSENCGGACCAVNCVLSAWSPWTSCSVSCGSGMRSRSRTKSSAESCGGTCDVLSESEPCSAGCCPSNCAWAAFGAWSGCSVTCGMGTQTRTRAIHTAEACGGSCPGNAMESQPCTQPACALPPVDCQVSQWAAWSACSATCGTSVTKSRTRTTTRAAENGGMPCPALMETISCGLSCCPVACVVSAWASWSACSVSCGSGMRSRSRTETTAAMCSGTPCPSLSESETCAAAVACAADCQLSMWSNWSTCSQACGTGEVRRTRSVVAAPANGGAACGALSESQPCMQAACACAVSAWSNWSPCSVTCGGGTTSRSRNVTMSASDCPPLSDSKACSTQPCARDCVLSAWATWSPCSVTCGGGRRERARSVTQAAVEPGMACPLDLTESEQCATQSCVAPGLACSEYSACTDCTDNGKTGPRRCQFCGSADGVGVCQSLNTVDGDASSGLRACAIDFDQRATTIAQCSTPATATPPATPMPVVIETVDVRSALNLGHNETMALVNVTLGDGSRLQVRVKGEEGAVLRALDGEGGIGVWSPSRDGGNSTNATASSYGHVRNGLAIEFLFAKDRPVAFRSLTLGEWDEGDTAQVSIGNDAFASDRRRQEDDTNTVVFVKQSEWTFDEKDTAAGFTKYVLSAVGESSFSIKSFQFTTVRPADSTRSADTTTVAIDNNNGQISESGSGGFQFDTMTIALIAAGGAVCVLLVILLIVCVARRRRRRNGKTGEESSSDSIGKSMDEMRPALGGTEFTLATTSSTEHSMPPPYMPLPAPNRYNDLQIVAPTASESAGVYQALPAQPHTGVSQAYVHVPHLEEHPSSGSPYTTVSSLHNSPAPFPGTAELYRPMPVAQRYDAVSGNEGLVNAIANSGHHLYRAPSANNGQGAAYSSGDLRGV